MTARRSDRGGRNADDDHFAQDVIWPGVESFARDYGLLRELKAFRSEYPLTSPKAQKFIRLFNKYNAECVYHHNGNLCVFALEREKPFYVIKPVNDKVLIFLNNSDRRALRYARTALLTGAVLIAVTASGTSYFLIVLIGVPAYFLLHGIGRIIGAKFGYVVW